MKSYFLPIGETAEAALPAVFSALSCGAAKEVPELTVLRVLSSAPSPVTESLTRDLQACHRLMGEEQSLPFFRTALGVETVRPRLPDRSVLCGGDASSLLLSALRGPDMPLSLQHDREAVEWAFSALLSSDAEDAGVFLRLRDRMARELAAGEEVRILLLCNLCDGFSAGAAFALIRFLRAGVPAAFSGMLLLVQPSGSSALAQLATADGALRALSERELIRAADNRSTGGADAAWLLSLPASLVSSADAWQPVYFSAARVLGEVFSAPRVPSAGMHTRELPGVMTFRALDQEAGACAAFVLSALWCLSDLFPSLHSFLEHPMLLRSLAPASRNGLFRRLFRSRDGVGEDLAVLERTIKVILLEMLTLLRGLSVSLRNGEKAAALWQEAVQACGRAVTCASEYDVSRTEARDSGVDRISPVHRDSMADTEEEALLRRLDEMAEKLSAALSARQEVFTRIGGFRARQALEDCRARCLTAEQSAREKLAVMPSDTAEERYRLGLQERRVRLLRAAVTRCDADLKEALKPGTLDACPSLRPASPFSGELVDPDLAERVFSELTASSPSEEDLQGIREHLSGLFPGQTVSDGKTLLKKLLAACHPADAGEPLGSLLQATLTVALSETAALRFSPVPEVPAVPLLPDWTDSERFFTVAGAPGLALAPAAEEDTGKKRGLLAMLLLRQYRRRTAEEAELVIDPCRREDSPLSLVYLHSRSAERAWIVSLSRREAPGEKPRKLPFAILLPGLGLECAFLTAAHSRLVPPFAIWFQQSPPAFQDPCPYFSTGDRTILTEQITRFRAVLKAPESRAFTDFLSAWHQDIVQARRADPEDAFLSVRLKVACGLTRLPAWQEDLSRMASFYEHFLSRDALCACLTEHPEADFPAVSSELPDDVLYTFRGMPLARENAERLLESVRLPEEAHLLSSLGTECDILAHSSDDYHEALSEGVAELLSRFPDALPAARAEAEKVLAEAREPVGEQITELKWPWDTVSASVLTILTECLGERLGREALHPFSDRLAVFPARGGEIIGDAMFSRMCVLHPPADRTAAPSEAEAAADPARGEGASAEGAIPVSPDAVLPCLSADFASALCSLAEGRTLLQDGFLRFERENGKIRTVMTLEGAFTLRMIREWQEEEVLSLYTHDMPTLALWPSVPFAPGDWQAYYVYAHLTGGERICARTANGQQVDITGQAPRFALALPSFPVCFILLQGENCIGALPNLLPTPQISPSGAWTACLDFGSSGSSVVFSVGGTRFPLHGPDMVRCLLRSPAASRDLLRREFFPALPLSAILPGALRIFRNAPVARPDGEEEKELPVPFRDGSILLSSSLRDVLDVPAEALYTDLKWTEEKGRAGNLYLHQVMLLTALQARCSGAETLGWRAAVPDEMAAGGRENLTRLLTALAQLVSRETGLSLPDKLPPVSFASESSALGAYFRLCAPEETRGGFLLLDLGADTADISLFLRGRESAVRTCQIPLGIHYMLLPDLLRRPELLVEDYGFLPDPGFQKDLAEMRELLLRARRDASALRQVRYALDALIADYTPLLHGALCQRMADGMPARTGALLLLYFSYLMMLSGLVLLQVSEDPGRNDFLPERMSLCLSGRGSGLIEMLSDRVKTSLWKLLTMFRNPKVSSLNLLFAAEKKLEIPVGLSCLTELRSGPPQPSAVPVTISVRPEELLPEFLLRFRKEFPQEALLLFPTLYANDLYAPFTPWGLQLMDEALRASFPPQDMKNPRPYSSLAACITTLLELSQAHPQEAPQ